RAGPRRRGPHPPGPARLPRRQAGPLQAPEGRSRPRRTAAHGHGEDPQIRAARDGLREDRGMTDDTTQPTGTPQPDLATLRADTLAFLAAHPPEAVRTEADRLAHLEARFDVGLAAVHYPEGLGGRGLPRHLQTQVDDILTAAGAPDNRPTRNVVNLGMAGPTILAAGTPEQKERFMRPLWTGRHVWCQLFS